MKPCRCTRQGTKPGITINELSAQTLAEVGIDITGNTPAERGIDGIDRMRLVRDDIASRVADRHTRPTNGATRPC